MSNPDVPEAAPRAPLRLIVERQVPNTYNGVRLECGHIVPRLMVSDLDRRRPGKDGSWRKAKLACMKCWLEARGVG